MLIISEPFLEVTSKLAQENSIGSLFVNFFPKTLPSTLAKGGERGLVFLIRAIEA
jgi:hypothetical protein